MGRKFSKGYRQLVRLGGGWLEGGRGGGKDFNEPRQKPLDQELKEFYESSMNDVDDNSLAYKGVI